MSDNKNDTTKGFQAHVESSRNAPRLLVDIPATCVLAKTREPIDCLIADISSLGLGLQLKAYVALGDFISVKFSLDGKSIEAKGKVAFVDGKIVGLAYIDIKEDDVKAISEHVNTYFFDRARQMKGFKK